ncbi:Crp/Fnr family transcriptional regulator [Siccirubricoccus deserti]
MVQSPGTALRMDAQTFREALEHIPTLRTLLLRYALVHHGQVARTAACNGRHHTDQRLARWLLMAHDRASGDGFPMTHEFLSMMLGVRRAGITVAAGQLQKQVSSITSEAASRLPIGPVSRAPPASATAWSGAPRTSCSGCRRGPGPSTAADTPSATCTCGIGQTGRAGGCLVLDVRHDGASRWLRPLGAAPAPGRTRYHVRQELPLPPA